MNMNDWSTCSHKWIEKIDSQFHSEHETDVYCMKCKCPGSRNNETDEIFWPAT